MYESGCSATLETEADFLNEQNQVVSCFCLCTVDHGVTVSFVPLINLFFFSTGGKTARVHQLVTVCNTETEAQHLACSLRFTKLTLCSFAESIITDVFILEVRFDQVLMIDVQVTVKHGGYQPKVC